MPKNTYDQVNQEYQTDLGRDARQDEYSIWRDDPNYHDSIYGSGEAQGYRKSVADKLDASNSAKQTYADSLDPEGARLRNGGYKEGEVYQQTPGSTLMTAPPNDFAQDGQWLKQKDGSGAWVWHFNSGAQPTAQGGAGANGGGTGIEPGGVNLNYYHPPGPTGVNGTPGAEVGGKGGGADDINSTDPTTRIRAALKAAGSTDDINYWIGKITGDPNGMGSAWAYWLDRINRGDGALAVRNGTMAKFNDGPAGGAGGGGAGGGGGTGGGGNPTGMGNGNPFAFNPSLSGGGFGVGAVDPATTMYNQNLRLQLLKQLSTLGTPSTNESESIKPALDAYNVQSKREEQNQRSQLAERYYAMGNTGGAGLDTGAFNTAVAQNMEKGGEARSANASSVVYQDNLNRRNQLQQMMQTAVNAGQTDAAQRIQMAIAEMDAKLQEQSLQQGFETSNNNLAFNYYNSDATNNRDAVLAAMRG